MSIGQTMFLIISLFFIGPIIMFLDKHKLWFAQRSRRMLVILCYGVSGNTAFTALGLVASKLFLGVQVENCCFYASILSLASVALTFFGIYYSEKEQSNG